MKVIIAEKPDQGTKLAAPFSAKKRNGYLEIQPQPLFPKGAYITWAVGHICELVSPEEYNKTWKKWSIETLPLIPNKFKYKVTRSKAKQFQIIKELLNRPEVSEIIIAGDAGREGELIVRTIIEQCRVKHPMKRLWISSLTENAVKEGFQNLLDESETRNLYFEAYSRACADWVVGMNASRVYTLLLQQKGISDVFSAGRVQTPTLALVVKREKEIEKFKSEPFWEIIARFDIEGKTYEGKWQKDGETRPKDKAIAEAIAKFCQDKPAVVKSVQKERKEFQPPFLFNLSSLQATANKAFKFSPKKTLDIAQKLYVRGIISYPRSDSSFVTKGEAESFPGILRKLSQFEEYKSYFPTPKDSLLDNKRFVNEKKVTDHYAIIPTEQVTNPKKLASDESKIYDLIVKRLIAAHYNQAIFDYTSIETLVDNRAEFISKGKQQIEEGWRKVLVAQAEKDDGETILPLVSEGEQGKVEDVHVKEGKTQPPKRFTEGQLITLMKTAGKHLENEELEKVMKETEGLGTEATRAGIITMLKERKYIDVEKNQVRPTQKGLLLIEAIGEQILASPEMTAKWEKRLKEIGQGAASAQVFMDQARKLSEKIITDAVKQSKEWNFSTINIEEVKMKSTRSRNEMNSQPKVVGYCKKCAGEVIDKGKFYGCSNYAKTNCDFTISKKILSKTISQANIKRLLKDGKTNLIKGFKKGERVFDASLEWDEKEKKISFSFTER
jgi:DNA topoisomerase III